MSLVRVEPDLENWTMFARRLAVYFLLCITLWLAPVLRMGAQNPVVQTKFTADPAPLVYGDRVYPHQSRRG